MTQANPDFTGFVLGKVDPGADFQPSAYYDPDGDCIEFVVSPDSYERLRRGEIGEFRSLRGIGQLLVAARIARGLTQRQLADRLGVHESQVSRDERNEYHGVTLDRAQRVLTALHIETRTTAELAEEPEPANA